MDAKLESARASVMERIYSLEVQGCLPSNGAQLAGHTALFNGVEPGLAAQAVWSLIDDRTLTYDPVTDDVDSRERLERLLGIDEWE